MNEAQILDDINAAIAAAKLAEDPDPSKAFPAKAELMGLLCRLRYKISQEGLNNSIKEGMAAG